MGDLIAARRYVAWIPWRSRSPGAAPAGEGLSRSGPPNATSGPGCNEQNGAYLLRIPAEVACPSDQRQVGACLALVLALSTPSYSVRVNHISLRGHRGRSVGWGSVSVVELRLPGQEVRTGGRAKELQYRSSRACAKHEKTKQRTPKLPERLGSPVVGARCTDSRWHRRRAMIAHPTLRAAPPPRSMSSSRHELKELWLPLRNLHLLPSLTHPAHI